MIYLSGTLHPALYGTPNVGMMLSPASSKPVPAGMVWAADNGAFLGKYPGDDAFLAWLDGKPRTGCLFAVAPDVVGDMALTYIRSLPMFRRIRELGFPVALAAQNGWEGVEVNWERFDVLFIGGDDRFKLGAEGKRAAADALAHGCHLHMGRANSRIRLHYAAGLGCRSADGTTIAYNPGRYVTEIQRWLSGINAPKFDLGL